MFSCVYCNKSFNSETGRQEHIETVHGASNIKVTTVNFIQSSDYIKTFQGITSVVRPQTTKSATKPKTTTAYPCSLCTKVYQTSSQLSQHKEDKHKIKSFECTSCSQFFKALKDLEQHKASKHGKTKQGNVKSQNACLLCSQVFKDALDLEKHNTIMHCNVPPTIPSVLAHQLIQSLASTQLIQNNTKPKNVCKLCSQSFKEPQHLEQHSIAKHGVNSVKLNNAHQNDLFKVHSLSSLNLNNIGLWQNVSTTLDNTNIIRCIYCLKRCKTLQQLDQHNNDVHKNKDYFPCHFCSKPFDTDLKRTGHLSQFHNFVVQQ